MRNQSPGVVSSLLAQDTSEAYLVLLTLEAAEDKFFYFTSDSVDTSYDVDRWVPDSTTWDASDIHWTDLGNNRFVYSRVGAQPSASVFTPDVSGLTDGVGYDVILTFSNVVGSSVVRPHLGAGNNPTFDISVSDGTHTVPIVYDNASPNVTLETLIGADTASFTVRVDSIRPTGSAPPQVYQAYPFEITLPTSVEGQVSTAQLAVTNVDRQLVESIRDQKVPIKVNIKVVLSSDPTDIMVEYVDFTWRQLSYDALTITGTLTLEDFLGEQVGHLMTGTLYPGLFYT